MLSFSFSILLLDKGVMMWNNACRVTFMATWILYQFRTGDNLLNKLLNSEEVNSI
jgi:hypothetical protein